jgi:hypothetical protein
MKYRFIVLFLAILYLSTGSCQNSKNISDIEKILTGIDSSILVDKNICQYIQPLFSDQGGEIFLEHIYFIDTAKQILYKAIFNDIQLSESVCFYYKNRKIIKIIFTDSSYNSKLYKCEYYLNNNIVSLVKKQGMLNPKRQWANHELVRLGKKYLIEYSSIYSRNK